MIRSNRNASSSPRRSGGSRASVPHLPWVPAFAGTTISFARIELAGSNDLSLPQLLDLPRAVAELGEDFVVMRAELRGDADLCRCLGEMPRRAVDFEPFAIFRVVGFGYVAVGQYIGIVGGFEQSVDR